MHKTRLRRITEEPPKVDFSSIVPPPRYVHKKLLGNITTQSSTMLLSNNVPTVNKDRNDSRHTYQASRTLPQPDGCRISTERTPLLPVSKRVRSGGNGTNTITPHQPIEGAKSGNPVIPKRSTSKVHPATRRRHKDFIAFHRHSCQLFSSLDGTLEQTRISMSLSSSMSSSASSASSIASPMTEFSSRSASLDYSHSSSPLGSTTTTGHEGKATDSTLHTRRPPLQRMRCVVSPLSTQDTTRDPPRILGSPQSNSKPVSQPISRSQPPISATPAYCSSQNTLPIPSPVITNIVQSNPITKTTIHWTSPESRRREHAKIDAANSGFRLLLRKVFPRVVCRKVGGGRAAFWDDRVGSCGTDGPDDDNARSVRRFRVDSCDTYRESYDEAHVEKEPLTVEQTEVEVETEVDSDIIQRSDGIQWNNEKGVSSRTGTDLSTLSCSSSRPTLPSFQSVRRDSVQKQRGSVLRRMLGCCS